MGVEHSMKSVLDPNVDPRLAESPLRNALWTKYGVKGDENSNNEYYLLELLNASPFFQDKSGGQKYGAPQSESNGECDANSEKYQIDFKVLISSSMAEAKANTEIQIEQVKPGVFYYTMSKDTEKVYHGSILLKVLRGYTCEDILTEKYLDEKGAIKDIHGMLKLLDKPKNLFLFYPSRFTFTEEMELGEKLNILNEAMQYDVYKLFEIRKHNKRNQFETFLCTIMEDLFVVFGDAGNRLTVVDVIKTEKCPTFKHLESMVF